MREGEFGKITWTRYPQVGAPCPQVLRVDLTTLDPDLTIEEVVRAALVLGLVPKFGFQQ